MVSWVFCSRDVCCKGLPYGNGFSDCVIINCITFLIKYGLLFRGILDDGYVFPINVCNTIYGNTHLSELVLQTSKGIDSHLHGNKLCAKDSCLNYGLTLQVSVNKDCVDIDQDAAMGTSGLFVPVMVTINEHMYVNWFAQGL